MQVNKYLLFLIVVITFLFINLFLNYETNNAALNNELNEYSRKDLISLKRLLSITFQDLNISPKENNLFPHDYSYILNPEYDICGKNDLQHDVTLLALVTSATNHFDRRLAIRRTWSNRSLFPNLRTVFILGKSSNQSLNEQIKLESEQFGDIVQEEFMDTYNNLTIKTMAAMKWSSLYCQNSRFYLKIDDDVVVNSFYLVNYLNQLASPLKKTFLCLYHTEAKVVRNVTNKFYISPEVYKEEVFKPYCGGAAYLFTSDVAPTFYKKSLSVKQFVFEDVYVGMLASMLKPDFISLRPNYCWKKSYCENAFHNNISSTYFFIVNGTTDLYQWWDMIDEKVWETKLY